MAQMDLFEKLTLTQVARWLDLHPFELARTLGATGRAAAELRFTEAEVDALRDLAMVETWWRGELPVADPVRGRALVRSLARLLVEHAGDGAGWTTRADNLYRGLEPADQWVVRRAINQLIRDGVLCSTSRSTGLHVALGEGARSRLATLADGSEVPASLEALWS